jgi:hypothetical protein
MTAMKAGSFESEGLLFFCCNAAQTADAKVERCAADVESKTMFD